MDQPIKLTREGLKHIIRNVLKEALDNDENNMFVIPKLPHTDNAFKVGDVLYVSQRKRVDNEYGRNEYTLADASFKIIGIEGDYLILDGKRKIAKQSSTLKCTAAWLKAYELFTGGNGSNQIENNLLLFDYQTIDGVDYVVIEARPHRFTNKQKYGYEYAKVAAGQNCQRVNFGVLTANKFENNFYCLPGKPKPDKYLNGGPQGSVHIPDDWVVLSARVQGSKFNTARFVSWNPEHKEEILQACPWLAQMKAPGLN